MTPTRVLAVLSALLCAALAGCSGADSPPADPPAAAPAGMSILGLVQDEGFAPVAGASVTLRLAGHATTTDEAGAFRFDGLVPSAYLVDVNATGYEPATLTAEPTATGNASLGFVLRRPASLQPSVSVSHFKGLFECAHEALIISGSCDALLVAAGQGPVFEDASTVQVPLGPRWQSVVADVVFDPAGQSGFDGLRLVVRGIDDAAGSGQYAQYGRFHGSGPFTARLDAGATYPDGTGPVPANLTALELTVYPQGHAWHSVCDPGESTCFAGAGAGTDVEFDLYVTVFYNQLAPEGYTLMDGA